MKRLLLIVSVLALAITASPAYANSGNEYGTTALNCQHHLGDGSVVSANYIRDQGDGAATGAVQLCRSGSYYWGYMVMYAPMPSTSWGIAYILRYENGVHKATYSCNNSGGNGYVEPGQTMCWTPRLYGANTSYTFLASSHVLYGTYPNGVYDAWGQTARTR